jgi:hypothetical protein
VERCEEHERADDDGERDRAAVDGGDDGERRGGVRDAGEVAGGAADETVEVAAGRVERRRRDERRPERDVARDERVRSRHGREPEDDGERGRLPESGAGASSEAHADG